MRRDARGIAVCALIMACGRSESHSTPRDSAAVDAAAQWTVGPTGIGPLRIGMTLQELNAAVGEALRPAYQVNESCDFVHPSVLPEGVDLMILADSVARVDVDAQGILTTEGAGVGDLESRILALYGGRAQVQPHKYTGPVGHYVIVDTPGDSLHRIIFETDGARVERYRAGRRPGVDFVEGCA